MKLKKIISISTVLCFGAIAMNSCQSISSEVDDTIFNIVLKYNTNQGNVIVSKATGNVGEKVAFTITPKAGYDVYNLEINETKQDVSLREFTPVSGINTISVDFKTTATVSFESVSHGTLAGDTSKKYFEGDSFTFTCTPETNYETEKITHNGSSVKLNEDKSTSYTISLSKGENKIGATFKEISSENPDPDPDPDPVEEDLYTIYFKDSSTWNKDGASSYITIYDASGAALNTTACEIGEAMEYLSNPGYYQGSNYWKYTLDFAQVKKIKITRGSEGVNWGASTPILDVTKENNLYTLDSENTEIWGDGSATGSWSSIDPNSIVRDEVTVSISVNDSTMGTATLDRTNALKGDTVNATIIPSEGYEVGEIKFNSVVVENSTRSFVLSETTNTILVTFKEKTSDPEVPSTFTIYFKDSPTWNNAGAATYIVTMDDSGAALNTTASEYGEVMTYLSNPGYYNGVNYWSYTIDPSVVKSVKFNRMGNDGTYWGSSTAVLSVNQATNLYSLDPEDTGIWTGSGDVADGTWSNIELSDIERASATCEVVVTNPTCGSATLNKESYLVGDTANLTVSPNEGYIVGLIKFNDAIVDSTKRDFLLEGATNTIEVTFIEGVAEQLDLYLYLSKSLSDAGTPNIYLWKDSVNNTWPGEALKLHLTDDDGRKIYVYQNVDIEKYQNCIFNLGGNQTSDLKISDALNGNNCFYLSGDDFGSGAWSAPTFLK